VKKVHGVELDMDNINLDDRPTYELLQRGDTSAVFQFESPGMKDVHKQIKPDRFEDLIAIVSLYRPGPMDNFPSYIKRKHGEEEITYLHPQLEPITERLPSTSPANAACSLEKLTREWSAILNYLK